MVPVDGLYPANLDHLRRMTLGGALVEAVFTQLSKTVAEFTAKKHFEAPPISVDTSQSREAVEAHLTLISNWASSVQFRDMPRSKTLSEAFVDLDLDVDSESDHRRVSGPRRVSDLASLKDHVVLLGDPGAGKTTSLKRIALDLLKQFRSNGFEASPPLLIRLRDLDPTTSILDAILGNLGIRLTIDPKLEVGERQVIRQQLAAKSLDILRPTVLVDGLDEIHPDLRATVVSTLARLILATSKCRFLLTCRIADYNYSLPGTTTLFLSALSPVQIRKFAVKWLGVHAASEFIDKVRRTPYAGAEVVPLRLAHLCAIYERTGTIPDKPRTVYRKIVRLMLEEWDEQRLIKRYSRYANFEVDRKQEFLEAVAFHIGLTGEGPSFSDALLNEVFKKIHLDFGLPVGEAEKVVEEIESHTGLIVELGWDSYEFAHKSLMEYLAGSYIARLPAVPQEVMFMPDATALATAVSAKPTDYFTAVVRKVSNSDVVPDGFTAPFLRRLHLEQVDFRPGSQLGAAVIRLYSRSYFPPADKSRPIWLHWIRPFLEMSMVRESVLTALSEGTLTASTVPAFRPTGSTVADQFSHFSNRRASHVYPLDTEFLQGVGYTR